MPAKETTVGISGDRSALCNDKIGSNLQFYSHLGRLNAYLTQVLKSKHVFSAATRSGAAGSEQNRDVGADALRIRVRVAKRQCQPNPAQPYLVFPVSSGSKKGRFTLTRASSDPHKPPRALVGDVYALMIKVAK